MDEGVASDGSPVEVYLALPPGETPALIDGAIPKGSTILELGSGPGRIARQLVSLGHRVVAVDDSPEMLSHIDYAETVLADLFSLDLGRRFDAVVAASHLINAPDRERRLELLAVCKAMSSERPSCSWSATSPPGRRHRAQARASWGQCTSNSS